MGAHRAERSGGSPGASFADPSDGFVTPDDTIPAGETGRPSPIARRTTAFRPNGLSRNVTKAPKVDFSTRMHHRVGMAERHPDPDPASVLATAVLNAGKTLGLRREEIATVIGRNRSRIRDGIDPDSKVGEAALLLVRIYRSLFALVDGDGETMRHWMSTPNRGTGGVPREQVRELVGLVTVAEYLDAIRGKP